MIIGGIIAAILGYAFAYILILMNRDEKEIIKMIKKVDYAKDKVNNAKH